MENLYGLLTSETVMGIAIVHAVIGANAKRWIPRLTRSRKGDKV